MVKTKCEKIAIKKLEKSDVKGIYLFADKKKYFFNQKMRNGIFMKDKNETALVESFNFY